MAYVHYDALAPVYTGLDPRLRACTPTEESTPASFYPEDIFRIQAQAGYYACRKYMATFWDAEHPVWVGIAADGSVLQEVIALRCPPYYPPNTFPGANVTDSPKPPGFAG